MEAISLSAAAKPLLEVAKMLAPHIKRLQAERDAGTDSSPVGTDLLEGPLDAILDRLANIDKHDSWWRGLLQWAQSQYITPDYLSKPSVREWLSEPDVRRDLKALVRASLLPTSEDSSPTIRRLAERHAGRTGEAMQLAIGPIDAIVNIAVASVYSPASGGDRLVAGLFQEGFSRLFAELQARDAAKISPNLSRQDRRIIDDAVTSPDPEHRRVAYLARRIVNMARATHELVLERRRLRPALDHLERARDEFSDSMFEGDLLRAEGKLGDAITQYERAVSLRPSDGLAAVALANALMDHAMLPAPDGKMFEGADEFGKAMHRSGVILVPFLDAGYGATNPAYLPAVWAYAHLWFHLAEKRVSTKEAALRSTAALIRADEAEPNNPITLRLLGRNLHRFSDEPSGVAEAYFQRAIDAAPSDVRHRFYYALFLTEIGRTNDAAVVFDQCVSTAPDDPDILEAYASLLSQRPDDAAQAELNWKHALRISPTHGVGWKHYGRFLARRPGGASRAEKVLQEGLANRPHDGPLWCEYAVVLEEQPGREKDAIIAYDRVLALTRGEVEPSFRFELLRIFVGAVPEPEKAGARFIDQGVATKDFRFVIAGCWLDVLYARPNRQDEALALLKSQRVHFGDSLQFLLQANIIAHVAASGNRFAEWLDPLCHVIIGEAPSSTLEGWDSWVAA